MHIDAPALPRGPRRTTSERLREALQELAEGHALIETHSEKSWASITFAGTRHVLDIVFEGWDALAAGENFIVFLPEHEFAIPRQLVADAAVTSVVHRGGWTPRMQVRVELLLLDEI